MCSDPCSMMQSDPGQRPMKRPVPPSPPPIRTCLLMLLFNTLQRSRIIYGDAMANPQIPDETVEAHTEEICSECGQAACATVMHETPDSVGTHSMDIGFRLVCPYCWMRPEVTRIPDEAAVTPPIDAITLSDRELLVRVMEALDAERAQNEVRYRLW